MACPSDNRTANKKRSGDKRIILTFSFDYNNCRTTVPFIKFYSFTNFFLPTEGINANDLFPAPLDHHSVTVKAKNFIVKRPAIFIRNVNTPDLGAIGIVTSQHYRPSGRGKVPGAERGEGRWIYDAVVPHEQREAGEYAMLAIPPPQFSPKSTSSKFFVVKIFVSRRKTSRSRERK